MKSPLPLRDGVGASSIVLPAGEWPSVLAFLAHRFPDIDAAIWQRRAAQGELVDDGGTAVALDGAYRPGRQLYYYRSLEQEPEIPFEAEILHRDAHLLVVDKPHFLPVLPAGRYLQQTLLVRLKRELGLAALVPLHRIDRGTAGLVVFSLDPDTRGAYQQLFPQRAVEKTYEAIAPDLPALDTPRLHRARLEPGEPFFRMREVAGEPNSETRIEKLATHGALAHYRLQPHTGRKHQLRVHLAALGAPILHDDYYPDLRPDLADDHARPLQLLARGLRFTDPLDGRERQFESRRRLAAAE